MTLVITLLSYFVILMDNSIVFTSSLQIGESLQLDSAHLAWVSNAYTITFGGFLLLAGRLSDLLGRKRIFQLGLVIFALSSLAIGYAQSAAMLIGARAVQGIGSAIIAPTSLALIMDAYIGEMRSKAIAYYGTTAGLGASIGLLMGGALTSLFSWRVGFLINVPIALLLVVLTWRYIKDSETVNSIIDYLGSILSVIGLSSLIYSLTADDNGFWFAIIGIIFLALFYWREKSITFPIMPLPLYTHKVRFGAYITRLLFMMSMLPYWFLIPQMLQQVYDVTPFGAGLAFLPMTIPQFMTALQVPRLSQYWKQSTIMMVGSALILLGLVATALIDIEQGYVLAVALPMIPLGMGQAMVITTVTSAGIFDTPKELAGAASGITNTMHQIGGPIGLSIIVGLNASYSEGLLIMAAYTAISMIIIKAFIVGRN
ncbi:MAG: MFS transporter [Veillonella sp.]|uniref:MFS transporter n=1 Tax=Veillonella sp. TaxID=1926307 RepID=UPI0025E03020|nr:MFS transporter [Veillonella sp.]MBE6080309.1 MFS transporter [Veillonella sp.]